MMLNVSKLIALAIMISQAYSFRLLSNVRITSTPKMSATSFLESSFFDPIKIPVSDYVSIWTPLFTSAKEAGLAPEFLIHWGHGIAMGTVYQSLFIINLFNRFYYSWEVLEHS